MAARTCLSGATLRPVSDDLPDPIRDYLAHTEAGISIRALARARGCHASTVLRQIRRTEQRRDDPLTDQALLVLGAKYRQRVHPGLSDLNGKDAGNMNDWTKIEPEKLARDCLMVLRALSEPGALLVVAEGVEGAIVAKNGPDGRPLRRAVLTQAVAEYLVIEEWIKPSASGGGGRIARYAITSSGRTELSRLVASAESARAAAQSLENENAGKRGHPRPTARAKAKRSAGADAPVQVLARRKRPSGEAFLTGGMIEAAERFRESFEIAQMGSQITQNWEALIQGRAGGRDGGAQRSLMGGTEAAVDRRMRAEASLNAAVLALGPELAECVILSCCHEQGMETIEDKLDFPARSGKIVLRIALASLERHYEACGKDEFNLIY